MGSCIERACLNHGLWEMDVDNVEECPACVREGLTEVQQLRKELAQAREALIILEKKRADWRQDYVELHNFIFKLVGALKDPEITWYRPFIDEAMDLLLKYCSAAKALKE